jgi:hypothetical protein
MSENKLTKQEMKQTFTKYFNAFKKAGFDTKDYSKEGHLFIGITLEGKMTFAIEVTETGFDYHFMTAEYNTEFLSCEDLLCFVGLILRTFIGESRGDYVDELKPFNLYVHGSAQSTRGTYKIVEYTGNVKYCCPDRSKAMGARVSSAVLKAAVNNKLVMLYNAKMSKDGKIVSLDNTHKIRSVKFINSADAINDITWKPISTLVTKVTVNENNR